MNKNTRFDCLKESKFNTESKTEPTTEPTTELRGSNNVKKKSRRS